MGSILSLGSPVTDSRVLRSEVSVGHLLRVLRDQSVHCCVYKHQSPGRNTVPDHDHHERRHVPRGRCVLAVHIRHVYHHAWDGSVYRSPTRLPDRRGSVLVCAWWVAGMAFQHGHVHPACRGRTLHGGSFVGRRVGVEAFAEGRPCLTRAPGRISRSHSVEGEAHA
jgi:hypothetical protein